MKIPRACKNGMISQANFSVVEFEFESNILRENISYLLRSVAEHEGISS